MIMRLVPFVSSIVAIILTYLIGKELYNKHVGLIAALMLSSFWSFTFFSYRLLVDVPVATLWLLGVWLFVKGYDHKKKWALWLCIPVIVLAFLMKFTGALLGFILIAYLLVTDKLKPLKNKDLWISLGLGVLAALPFLIYEIKKFGHPFAFYVSAIGGRAESPRSLWQTLMDYINTTFPHVHYAFLTLFIIGIALLLIELTIGFDLLWKNKEKKLKSNLLVLLTFLIPFLYIVSIGYGTYIEERYLFLMYPFMFIIAGKGLMSIFDHVKRYNKAIAIAIVVAFLAIGFYQNMIHTNKVIDEKSMSFIQVKQAGQWIKEHSSPEDKIYSYHTQAELQYAAVREVRGIPGNSPEELIEAMKKDKPKYIVMNIFANINAANEWKIVFPYINQHIFKPEISYRPFIDEEQKIPILTVFSINPAIYTANVSSREQV